MSMLKTARDHFKHGSPLLNGMAALMISCGLLFVTGCSAGEDTKQSHVIFAMDTYIDIGAYGATDRVFDRIDNEVDLIEKELSVTDPDSDIYALNRDKSRTVPEEVVRIIQKALLLCDETGGALDISIYPIVREWGFTTGNYHVPDDDTIERLLSSVDYRKVVIEDDTISMASDMMIDLGACAKGYTGDEIAEILSSEGIDSAVIDLGGNIRTLGTKPDGTPWKVAVRAPSGREIIGVIKSSDESVITSGGYERYFEDEEGNIWWHIIDPATGKSARNGTTSVTVVGTEGIRCDALSTALFVMGKEEAIKFWQGRKDFDMIIVTEDDQVYITPSLYQRFTPQNGNMKIKVIGNEDQD